MKVLVGLTAAALLAGCVMRVGPAQARLPRPDAFVPAIERATVAASADAVIAVQPNWDARPLGEEGWVMVGSSAEGGRWITLLRFELEAIAVQDSAARLEGVELVLPVRFDPPQPYPMSDVEVGVFVVVDTWEESHVEWSSRPWVFERAQATLRFDGSGTDADRVDVTALVDNALRAGQTQLNVALVVTDASSPMRRIWNARESVVAPSGTSAATAPHLAVSWSSLSSPRSAAQQTLR